MSTRSLIARKLPDGKYESIYCHWDGYPEHNGAILKEHYTASDKIDALFRLGNLSVLGEEIGEEHNFDNHDVHVCTAYGRDRGERDTKSRMSQDRTRLIARAAKVDAEYIYVWDNDDESWGTIDLSLEW